MKDIILDAPTKKKIRLVPVDRIEDVLELVLDWTGQKRMLSRIKRGVGA